MSDLRERARAVKARGVEERGNFEPTGAPKDLYNYWLKHTRSSKGDAIRWGDRKENFCHFWRVVAIWAPLTAVRRGFKKAAPVFAVLLALGAIAGFSTASFVVNDFLLFVGQVLLTIVGIALGAMAAISGISLGVAEVDRHAADLPPKGVAIPFAVVGAPISLTTFSATKFIRYWLDHWKPYNKRIVLGAAITAVAGIFTIIGMNSTAALVFSLNTFAAIVVLAVGGYFILPQISDYISGKRALREERERAENEAKRKADYDALMAYLKEHGTLPPTKEKKAVPESPISKFFKGVGDFIIFIAQVVRVNKWKICPLVEVDTK